MSSAMASHSSGATAPPLVAVLLCTYQGEDFLAVQLNSIARQSHRRWQVWASDDGSSDRTRPILELFRKQWGGTHLNVVTGPRSGFVANFVSQLRNADIRADYFAYADQDDYWEADKFERALAWLETVPRDVPALYMTRTRLIDDEGKDIGYAPLFTARPPTFANAIVQSIGGGNTMVFNAAARALMQAHTPDVALVSHDWWTYMLITGAGGRVHYDTYPSVRYRQHGANVFGANAGLSNRLIRATRVFAGRFKTWGEINMRSLACVRDQLTPENQRIFETFAAARSGSLPARLLALKRSGVHRQGFVDNIGLYVAALFNRL